LGSRTYDSCKNSFLSPDHYQTGTSAQDLSIEVDPLTENAYTFVDGDPINLFDPTGHHPAYDQDFSGEAQQQMADYGAALRLKR
jgi:RHS repeat-associated protein